MKFSRPIIVAFMLVLVTTFSARAGIYIWDGGSPVFNWIDAGDNWDHDVAPPSNLLTTDLVFAGGHQLYVSSLTPYSVHGITFNASAGAFDISPQPLSVGTGGIENDSTSKMHFSTPISFSDVPNTTIDAVSGSLAFDDKVTLPSGTLTCIRRAFPRILPLTTYLE